MTRRNFSVNLRLQDTLFLMFYGIKSSFYEGKGQITFDCDYGP